MVETKTLHVGGELRFGGIGKVRNNPVDLVVSAIGSYKYRLDLNQTERTESLVRLHSKPFPATRNLKKAPSSFVSRHPMETIGIIELQSIRFIPVYCVRS